MNTKRVLVISTGGTIAMTNGTGAGITPTLSGKDLVRAAPELARKADLEVVSFSTKPGASLTLEELIEIAELVDSRVSEHFSGAVVVQGTDTIEETAFVLDLLVKSERPVVVTGAMRSAAAPSADGPANLLAAVTVASDPIAASLGTLVVLNDEVHAARYVQKTHTGMPSAFSSPGFAPLGRVIEGRLHLYATLPRLPLLPYPKNVSDFPIALIKITLGDDGRLLSALPGLGYRGVVIEAMGAGHLPARLAESVSSLVQKIPVVLSTRVASGPVFTETYGFAGSEMDLIERGAIPGGCLAGLKACALLRLLVANKFEGLELKLAFAQRSNGLGIAAR
jgi:L-asparaginase